MKQSDSLSWKRKCKKFYEDNKTKIIDIVIFGSYIKDKVNPTDIDLCIITNSSKAKAIELSEQLQHKLDAKFHVSYLLIDDFLKKPEPIWLSIFHEGESIITGRKLAETIFSEPRVLFKYDTSKLSYTNKIRFYYALKGRDGKTGVVKSTNSDFLAKTILLSPVSSDGQLISFFKEWNVPFTRQRILIEKY